LYLLKIGELLFKKVYSTVTLLYRQVKAVWSTVKKPVINESSKNNTLHFQLNQFVSRSPERIEPLFV